MRYAIDCRQIDCSFGQRDSDDAIEIRNSLQTEANALQEQRSGA
jgi:hypothetical protein